MGRPLPILPNFDHCHVGRPRPYFSTSASFYIETLIQLFCVMYVAFLCMCYIDNMNITCFLLLFIFYYTFIIYIFVIAGAVRSGGWEVLQRAALGQNFYQKPRLRWRLRDDRKGNVVKALDFQKFSKVFNHVVPFISNDLVWFDFHNVRNIGICDLQKIPVKTFSLEKMRKAFYEYLKLKMFKALGNVFNVFLLWSLPSFL